MICVNLTSKNCTPPRETVTALYCYKETRWWVGRHKQELEQETIERTRTGKKC